MPAVRPVTLAQMIDCGRSVSASVLACFACTMGPLSLLQHLLTLYSGIIIVRVLISWVRLDPRNPIVQFLTAITEPVLAPLRNLVPPRVFGGLDLSPILALGLIALVRRILWAALS